MSSRQAWAMLQDLVSTNQLSNWPTDQPTNLEQTIFRPLEIQLWDAEWTVITVYYGLIVPSPLPSYIELLILNSSEDDCLSRGNWCKVRSYNLIWLCLYKAMWERRGKVTIYKWNREALKETKPSNALILDIQPLELWENKLVLFKSPLCGILL